MINFTDIEMVDSKNFHIFTVDTYKKKSPKGDIAEFVKLKAPDWVGAIVFDKLRQNYILVKEYRHGVDKVVTQFPCGTVEQGEAPIDAILRELREEIGIKNSDVVKIEQLFTGCQNRAFMNNSMTFFYVEINSWESGKQKLDENEFVEPVLLTSEAIDTVFEKELLSDITQRYAWLKFKTLQFPYPR